MLLLDEVKLRDHQQKIQEIRWGAHSAPQTP